MVETNYLMISLQKINKKTLNCHTSKRFPQNSLTVRKTPLPSTRVSNWQSNCVICPCPKQSNTTQKTPHKLCNEYKISTRRNEDLRYRRWHTQKLNVYFWRTGLPEWVAGRHPRSPRAPPTCHNTARRPVAPGWRLVTAAQQCSSYLTCKLMPKPDWLTPFSRWGCNAFWGYRLNIGWHTK